MIGDDDTSPNHEIHGIRPFEINSIPTCDAEAVKRAVAEEDEEGKQKHQAFLYCGLDRVGFRG